jgi:hypothetical protein
MNTRDLVDEITDFIFYLRQMEKPLSEEEKAALLALQEELVEVVA